MKSKHYHIIFIIFYTRNQLTLIIFNKSSYHLLNRNHLLNRESVNYHIIKRSLNLSYYFKQEIIKQNITGKNRLYKNLRGGSNKLQFTGSRTHPAPPYIDQSSRGSCSGPMPKTHKHQNQPLARCYILHLLKTHHQNHHPLAPHFLIFHRIHPLNFGI